ncbi:MAG: hypothetical protein WCC37_25725, partial [Candidatus Sulfotelmatobacter sp.]
MELRPSVQAAAAKPAQSIPQPVNLNSATLDRVSVAAPAPAPAVAAEARRKFSGYGLPCIKCKLYYPANLDTCPNCNTGERISPTVAPLVVRPQAEVEPVPDTAIVEQEREAFLKEFKSQLFAAHAEVANSPVICTLGENHVKGAEAASVCKPCYERLQERVDVCEAALHMDVKDAAQIVYDAVWADPSDPS